MLMKKESSNEKFRSVRPSPKNHNRMCKPDLSALNRMEQVTTTSSAWRESVPPVVLMPLICFKKKKVKKGQYIGRVMNISPLEIPDGKEKKKISLIQKDTPPVQLFSYFKELLKMYPGHSFMARWQCEQLDNLLDHLPLGHVVCVYDYSEGYTCRKQDKIQSEYYYVAKVSLHVTILYHHAVEAVDGVESTEEDPQTVKEHIFVISDDPGQDHDTQSPRAHQQLPH